MCTWTNKRYNKEDFSLRHCIDCDILQISKALHVSGLLEHGSINKEGEVIIDSDGNAELDLESGIDDSLTDYSPSSEEGSSQEDSDLDRTK